MKPMAIAAVLVTFPALVVIVLALFMDSSWLLPAVAATLFTAFPFILAIIWLRNQHRREQRREP